MQKPNASNELGAARKSILALVLLEALGKPIGFLTSVIIAFYFGTGDTFDVFTWSISILLLILGIVTGSWPNVITPIMNSIKVREPESSLRFSGNVLALGLITLTLIGALIFFKPYVFVRLLSNFPPAKQNMAAKFLRLLVPFFLLTGFYQLEKSLLNSEGEFRVPACAEFLGRFVLMFSLLFSAPSLGGNSLPLGYNAVALVTTAIAFMAWKRLRNCSTAISFDFSGSQQWLRETAFLVYPFYISQFITSSVEILSRYLASGMGQGALSYLNYGSQIIPVITTSLAIGMSNVLFTEFSREFAQGNLNKFADIFNRSINFTWAVIMPISGFLFFFADDIVALLFMRGAFDQTSAQNTAEVLRIISLGLPASAAHFFTNKAFMSSHDNVTPMFYAIGMCFINCPLYIVLGKVYGFRGIAWATTLSALISFWSLLILFSSRKHRLPLLTYLYWFCTLFGLVAICFGISSSVVKNFSNHIACHSTVKILLRTILGGLVSGFACFALGTSLQIAPITQSWDEFRKLHSLTRNKIWSIIA